MRKLIVGLFVFALLFVLFIGPSATERFEDGTTILTEESSLQAPIVEIQTKNVPIPKIIMKLDTEDSAGSAQADESAAESQPVCPPAPPCPECPKFSSPEGKRYSELVKELLIEGDLLREFRNNP